MFENDLRKNEQFNMYVINDLNDVSLSFRKPYSIDTDKTTNPWTTTLKKYFIFLFSAELYSYHCRSLWW